ncbi:hypothetical protein I6A84_24160 [Frankia sp. CNm7]|uniref:Uncharacterized protein n=1 Tax=Frankia nepalensis TaxID=1836974 RepID=A0A937UUQ9_9ACTN|nr:hypothetical protein [Frankia nepalensis]MBL7501703.1 hypothetical protein [Frankia nepalensis]MBL7513462.1 hypothetical protein [Frankia nepalensis]MBL7521098.1 hypothetical protein [Frankia nepalensis]MBL7632505.1 hypothetical protein [Frankia nepalensis]
MSTAVPSTDDAARPTVGRESAPVVAPSMAGTRFNHAEVVLPAMTAAEEARTPIARPVAPSAPAAPAGFRLNHAEVVLPGLAR